MKLVDDFFRDLAHGVAGLGAVPLRIEGVLDEGRLQVTTAIAAAGHRVRVRTSPDPRSARRSPALRGAD